MRTPKNIFYLLNLLLFLALFIPGKAKGQIVDSSFLKEFNNFNNRINQEFEAFSHQNDSIFILFLQKSWKEFEGKENPMPVSPKPINQPKIDQIDAEENLNDSTGIEIIIDEIISPNKEPQPPQKDALGNSSTVRSFSFYGNRILLYTDGKGLPALTNTNRQGILDYFVKAGNSAELNEIVINLKLKSERYKLNDWGFASLLLQAAETYYSNVNDRVLFTWIGLLHSGYNVKVGYSNRRVYLLIPANVQLYTVSYTIGNKDYFVLGPGPVPAESEKVYIHEADYPGNKTDFDFLINKVPRLGNEECNRSFKYEKAFSLRLNKNLIEFYQNYPPCELGVYFNTPISPSLAQQLDAFLLPLLEGKNDNERLAILLDYMQQAIVYKADREQFGKERYFFPDETLYYPGADCEDRSVLFARLIERYSKLDAIGLSYPMHVTMAVASPDCEGGEYVSYRGKRFYHCDPTYLGALCGMVMPAVKNSKAEVVYQIF